MTSVAKFRQPRSGARQRGEIASGLPLLVAVAAALLSFFVWHSLRQQEEHQMSTLLENQARAIRDQLQFSFQRQVMALNRMAERFDAAQGLSKELWSKDARNLLRDYENFKAIEWIDSNYIVQWIEPLAGNEAALHYNVASNEDRRVRMETARNQGIIDASPVIHLQQGGLGIVVYAPIGEAENFRGFIVGVFRVEKLIQSLIDQLNLQNQTVWVFEEDHLVFGDRSDQEIAKMHADVSFTPFQLQWRLEIHPHQSWVASHRTHLSLFVLCSGLFIGVLMAWLVRSAQTLSQQTANLAQTNLSLEREIRERQRAQDSLSHMANHDALTDLPNRSFFQEDLGQSIELARRQQSQLAVMLVDLDHFKKVNDTLGHQHGDLLLKQVVERFRSILQDNMTLARASGDEFLLMMEKSDSVEEVIAIANDVLHSFRQSFYVGEQEIFITASIGIAMYPDSGDNAETLIRSADAALYKAKDAGRNNYQFYTTGMHSEALRRLELDKDLHGALESQSFLLYYQPKIDMRSQRVVGAEALIRWQHPQKGMIPPVEFIPLAEDTGLILDIGHWVVAEACRQLQKWEETPLKHLSVAVNISGRQLKDSRLLERTQDCLTRYAVRPSCLEFELTEEVFIDQVEHNQAQLRALRNLGLSLAIDDFGIGYSSLAYLKNFPINSLKIDRSFIRNVTTNRDDAVIVNAVISMAHNLQLKVIAEGVETLEHVHFLEQLNCDQAQGFYFARPMPVAEFEEFVQNQLAENRPA